MDMLQIHAEALDSGRAAYHEFLIFYRADSKVVYGFIEGQNDHNFYKGLIESCLPHCWKVKLIGAGGKKRVWDTYSLMDWVRFPLKRVCFFIDRDLSEFLCQECGEAENLYVTDCYSIENSIVGVETFERALEEIFNIRGLTPDEQLKITAIFNSNLETFREQMVPLMAQIIVWRRKGKNVSLDSIKMKEIFSFTDGVIVVKPETKEKVNLLQHIGKKCGLDCLLPEDIIEIEIEFRQKNGPERYIRGKYLFWFFVKCAENIHQTISKFCSKYISPPKVCISLGIGNALSVLGPRTRIPASLEEFLERNYCHYIQKLEMEGGMVP